MRGPYTTEPGPSYRAGKLRLWCEDGLCFWESQEDGEVGMLTSQEVRSRLRMFEGELAVWDRHSIDPDPKTRAHGIDRYRETKRICEVLTHCLDDIKRQGDQTDPEVIRRKFEVFLREKRAGYGGSTTRSIVDARFGAD